MTKEEREKWDAMPPAEQHRLNMVMADQFAWADEMLAELERQHNTKERRETRERIANNIGRPLNTDMTYLDPRWVEYTKTGKLDIPETRKMEDPNKIDVDGLLGGNTVYDRLPERKQE
jgi:hypothetical protein